MDAVSLYGKLFFCFCLWSLESSLNFSTVGCFHLNLSFIQTTQTRHVFEMLMKSEWPQIGSTHRQLVRFHHATVRSCYAETEMYCSDKRSLPHFCIWSNPKDWPQVNVSAISFHFKCSEKYISISITAPWLIYADGKGHRGWVNGGRSKWNWILNMALNSKMSFRNLKVAACEIPLSIKV